MITINVFTVKSVIDFKSNSNVCTLLNLNTSLGIYLFAFVGNLMWVHTRCKKRKQNQRFVQPSYLFFLIITRTKTRWANPSSS